MTDTITNSFNLDCFSDGQVKSKIWLCNILEKHLPFKSNIAILGGWYNLLGFMLLTRNPENYKMIDNYDIDINATNIANSVTDAWNKKIVNNYNKDCYDVNYDKYDCIINCSPEHMIDNTWLEKIPAGKLVCIQSSNVTDPNHPWYIKTPSRDLKDFSENFVLSKVIYLDEMNIDYDSWGYKRFMLTGLK